MPRSLVNLADRERSTILPGYTHLQWAQPILFATGCGVRIDAGPRRGTPRRLPRARQHLPARFGGALAGTTYAIDRAKLARILALPSRVQQPRRDRRPRL